MDSKQKNNGGYVYCLYVKNENLKDLKKMLRLYDTHFDYLLNNMKFKIQKEKKDTLKPYQ